MASTPPRSHTDVVDLRVNYQSHPNDVPATEARFSWRVATDHRDARQTAYRIIVARSRPAITEERGDVWDSGRIDSPNATDVAYDGPALEARTEYHWAVRIWDENGDPLPWAGPASFVTAPADTADWDGAWIGYRPGIGDANGYRSRWHASSTDAEEWVQVDLGERHPIEQVDLHPADPFDGPKTPDGKAVSALYTNETDEEMTLAAEGAAGFGFPRRYRIEVADEPSFSDARTIADRSTDEHDNPGAQTVSHETDVEGRYVRVTATDLYEFDPASPPVDRFPQLKPDLVREERRAWQTFALAALAIRNETEEDVAIGGAVSASSSVEDATWSRRHLVNGHYGPHTAPGSPLLRTEVDLAKEVDRAWARFCGLGYGELYLNGEQVGEDVLNPAWSQYDERVAYSTYDVGDLLDPGENAIGIWLGRGWFSRNARDWTGFGSPRATLELEIEYADGTTRTIGTDGTWRATKSPLLENDLYDGEVYDARAEQTGWATADFEDESWEEATVVDGPGGRLVPQRTPPIRATETIEPEEVIERDAGPIIDFGQNLVGWLELTIEGADAGEEIELQHAEVLLEDGSLNRIDLRSADATDTYIAKGGGVERYEPRFTYHGFRYAQVIGYPGELDVENIRAKAVHSDLDPSGSFDCSNQDLVQVQRNAKWGLRGNVHGVVTDCPQRDERFGWTGDNHIAARALIYNFDAARFYEKWMDDHADIRSDHGYVADTIPHGYGTIPEDRTWGITQVTIPWHLYRHYGDISVLKRHYDGMRRYIDYWHSVSDGGYVGEECGNYGDWLTFENNEGPRGLPLDLFNTAFHYHTTNLFAKSADVLGRTADATRYRDRAAEIADTFNETFLDVERSQYGPGTQSSYAVPLFVGVVPDEHVDDVAATLVQKVREDDGKLRTGFLGTRPLIHTLVDHGYAELAYEVVSQPERPGWVYMVRQGATTMWERWDSDDRVGDGMNSFNHSPFNFVSEWFYYALVGLRCDDSMYGGGSVVIAPAIIEDLVWASGELETVFGRLASRWERTGDGITLVVDVPWNTDAIVRVPGEPDELQVVEGNDTIWEEGTEQALPDGVKAATAGEHEIAMTVGSGAYRFEVR